MQSMCSLGELLIQSSNYVTSGCASLSLGTVTALLTGTKCLELTENDLHSVLDILKMCAPFYHNSSSVSDCLTSGCSDIPSVCMDYGDVNAILHILTDHEFLGPLIMQEDLRYALMLVDLPRDTWDDFYMECLDNKHLENDAVHITGIDSEIKNDIFSIYLMIDIGYFGLAAVIIVLIMCAYLGSIFITMATLLNVTFSILLAYAAYSAILQFPFFSFINLPTILILIAIGADDVFIFWETWQVVKKNHPDEDMSYWISKTLDHAAVSIFVTSLTTAFAFLTNLVSNITSIKCFAIFSCVAILFNFVLVITWIPAVTVILEKISQKRMSKEMGCKIIEKLKIQVQFFSNYIFYVALPTLVEKLWFLWIAIFIAFGVWGFVVVLVEPKLGLPTSARQHSFMPNHPLEQFETLQFQFQFASQHLQDEFPISFIWGIHARDNGDYLDPDDHGYLELDEGFDMTSLQAWIWIRDFCTSTRIASFVSETARNSSCLMGLFVDYIRTPCKNATDSLCCGHNDTLPEGVFSDCFSVFMNHDNNQTLGSTLDRPYFDQNNTVVAYQLQVPASQSWSESFNVMGDLYDTLDKFMEEKRIDAVSGVNEGWFISEFAFYDLQLALSSGMYQAILISLACAAVVMLFTSLNVLITLYAITTITFTIFFTVGILVMLGWELNILESTIITLSTGLSIDFSIHYGMAYSLAESKQRCGRVRESLSHVGSPVFMASMTTFLAGAAIMPSGLVVYRQLGIFLMLIMTTSWSYATFMFLSLCRIIGPNDNMGHIPSPFSYCSKLEDKKTKSEQLKLEDKKTEDCPDFKNISIWAEVSKNTIFTSSANGIVPIEICMVSKDENV